MHNVRDFGAKGDGITLDTAAIQKAIDAGGLVCFPPGEYLSGTLYLKSNGGLYLEAGAVLKASPCKEDYNADDFCTQNRVFSSENVSGAHFITAVEQENITLCGPGRIDGNRQAFYGSKTQPTPYGKLTEHFDHKELANGWRPAQMIFFCECTNVHISDVQMYNSPYWTTFLHGCEDVFIRGVRVLNAMGTLNGDGIDIDCCCRVTISDCIIDTGDDCITLRGNNAALKNPRACEYISITNCSIRTRCNAFRIGVGTGIVRKAVISNCTIRDSRTGINICSQYSPGKSVQIEDISFENLYIEAIRPISIQTNAWGKRLGESDKVIRNISFHHIRGVGKCSCTIAGHAPGNMKNISLKDVELEYRDSDLISFDPEGDVYNGSTCSAPAALCCLNVEGLILKEYFIRWNTQSDHWKYGTLLDNCSKVTLQENDFGKEIRYGTKTE